MTLISQLWIMLRSKILLVVVMLIWLPRTETYQNKIMVKWILGETEIIVKPIFISVMAQMCSNKQV